MLECRVAIGPCPTAKASACACLLCVTYRHSAFAYVVCMQVRHTYKHVRGVSAECSVRAKGGHQQYVRCTLRSRRPVALLSISKCCMPQTDLTSNAQGWLSGLHKQTRRPVSTAQVHLPWLHTASPYSCLERVALLSMLRPICALIIRHSLTPAACQRRHECLRCHCLRQGHSAPHSAIACARTFGAAVVSRCEAEPTNVRAATAWQTGGT